MAHSFYTSENIISFDIKRHNCFVNVDYLKVFMKNSKRILLIQLILKSLDNVNIFRAYKST